MKDRLSHAFRSRRDEHLRQVLAECPRQGSQLRILDIGGRTAYWHRVGIDFLRGIDARITLLNLTADEIAVDASGGATGDTGDLFETAVGSGCALDYADGAFDLCHSNSVIEHVGLWRDMVAFAAETRRVAPAHYVQSPNFWFPIDPHFWGLPGYHWLPRPTRASLLRAFPLATGGRATDVGHGFEMVDAVRLLTRSQMRFLFPDSELTAERLFLLPKSYTAVANPGGGPARATANHG